MAMLLIMSMSILALSPPLTHYSKVRKLMLGQNWVKVTHSQFNFVHWVTMAARLPATSKFAAWIGSFHYCVSTH